MKMIIIILQLSRFSWLADRFAVLVRRLYTFHYSFYFYLLRE